MSTFYTAVDNDIVKWPRSDIKEFILTMEMKNIKFTMDHGESIYIFNPLTIDRIRQVSEFVRQGGGEQHDSISREWPYFNMQMILLESIHFPLGMHK